MNPFRGRKLAVSCTFFLTAAFGCALLSFSLAGKLILIAVAVVTLLGTALVTCFVPRLRFVRGVIIVSCSGVIFAVALSLLCLNYGYDTRTLALENTESHIEGVVYDVTYTSTYSGYYLVRLRSIDGASSNLRVKLAANDGDLQCGDVIETDVVFLRLNEDVDGFAEERYYLSRKVLIGAETLDNAEVVVTGTAVSWTDHFQRFRRYLSAVVTNAVNGADEGLTAAILLGDRSRLSDTVRRDFACLGITHLLAVSGMHLSILMAGTERILRGMRLHRWTSTLLLLLLTLFYMALTGFSASVLRAGLMFIIAKLFSLAGHDADSLTSLLFSVTLICICSPFAVFDVGLLLSFLASASLILTQPLFGLLHTSRLFKMLAVCQIQSPFPLRLFAGFMQAILTMLLTGTLVTLFTLPAVWVYFGRVSLLSPLSGVVFIPLVTALLSVAPLMLLLFPFPLFAAVAAKCALLLCRVILFLSSMAKHVSFAYISLRYDFAPVCIILIFVSVFAMLLVSKKKRVIPFGTLVLSTLIFGICIFVSQAVSASYLTVTCLTYGKNDGFLITCGGDALLCDISDGSYSIVRKGLYEAEKVNFTEIRVVLFTHYHQRHIRTFNRLCNKAYVRELWLPEPVSESDFNIYPSLLAAAEAQEISCVTYSRTETASLSFNDVGIRLPEYAKLKRSTHPVIAMEITAPLHPFSIAYLGASAHELTGGAGEFVQGIAAGAGAVIFGIHGPIYKMPFAYSLTEQLRAVIYSGETPLEFADLVSEAPAIVNDSSHTIIIKP